MTLVSYLVITRDRPRDLEAALASIAAQTYAPSEVIVVDNASTPPVADVAARFDAPGRPLRYHRLETNAGVSGGRNAAMRLARGEVFIALDDDAVFAAPDAAARAVARLEGDPTVGALAFRVVDETGAMRPREFATFDRSQDPDREFETAYFVGAGHALRRAAVEAVGGYVEHFFFGHEEWELSLRLIDAGFRIVYVPFVTVVHRKTDTARLSPGRVVALDLRNRLEIGVRHLPWPYVLSQQVVRMGHALVLLRGNPLPVLAHVAWSARNLGRLVRERRPLGRDTLARLRRARGRLLY